MDAHRTVAEIDAELTAPGQPFEIEQVQIRGVGTRVWKNAPATLVDILRRSRDYGDRTFLVYEGEHLTFEQHFRAAARVARVLRDRFGVKKGDRVAIAMRNYPEWSAAFWGATAAGAVVVLLNAWWTADELAFGLADSGSRVVFVDAARAGRLAGIPPGPAVVVARAEGEDVPAGALTWAAVMGEAAAGTELPEVDLDTDDDATILYTSGTTGRPKGVLGTHRNICTNPISALYVAARTAARAGGAPAPAGGPASAYLLSVPLFHATGCHSLLVGHVYNGGKMVMMHRWDPGRALELIEQERITAFGGVPTMALQVLDHPDFGKRDVSSVRSVRYGGAPAPPDLARRIEEQFNSSQGMNGYGMTETSALATMNAGADYLARPDSVGVPVPVVEARIVDPAGRDLGAGQVGELWMKGPNVVKGYWNRPEETAATFTDGWVHTGDVARIDGEGFVYIVDRAKDMLIRGGENVYCVEVEGVLHQHPAVAEAAVIGVPHPSLGEEVGAVVSLLPGRAVSGPELQEYAGARLAGFKVPSRIWFRPGPLPRNPGGKVLKRDLREQLAHPDGDGPPAR